LGVERLRLSYDNNHLFSSGKDGVVCFFNVKDKDHKGRKDGASTGGIMKDLASEMMSEEILIPLAERDKYKEDVEQLKANIAYQKDIAEKKI